MLKLNGAPAMGAALALSAALLAPAAVRAQDTVIIVPSQTARIAARGPVSQYLATADYHYLRDLGLSTRRIAAITLMAHHAGVDPMWVAHRNVFGARLSEIAAGFNMDLDQVRDSADELARQFPPHTPGMGNVANRVSFMDGGTVYAATPMYMPQTTAIPTNLPQGTPVEVVGVVSSQPRNAGVAVEEKMQVAVGPDRTDYTLHLDDAKMFDVNGGEIAASDFRDRWWVRAVGTVMDDSRRINVQRLQVLAKEDESFRTSQYYRRQFQHGYVSPMGTTQVAGARLEQGPFTYTGTITSIDRNAGFMTLREENGTERRIAIGAGADLPNLNVGDRVSVRVTNEHR